MKRMERLLGMAKNAQVRRIGTSYYFLIHGEHDHEVIYNSGGKWLCDCEWFSIKGKECSHIMAARIAFKELLEEVGKKR